MSSEKGKVLVYVQAIPVSSSSGESSREKSFVEYFQNSAEFTMTHSSKVALEKAQLLGTSDVTAIGYSPILHEAMARGASAGISVPACDTPYRQARTFPQGNFEILIGENGDGLFNGASLAGALVAMHGYVFRMWGEEKPEYLENSVVLVKDLLQPTPGIDIRRVKRASEARFEAEAVDGNSRILSIPSARNEILSGNSKDLSSALSKRLRRNLPITR